MVIHFDMCVPHQTMLASEEVCYNLFIMCSLYEECDVIKDISHKNMYDPGKYVILACDWSNR